MNTVHPSAGVYTKETDLSQRVQGVSTSIGVCVGAAARGPVNERTLITDNAEYTETFGASDARRYGFMSFSAKAFLSEGSRLYVTRVVNGALTAGAYVTVDDPSSASPSLAINNFDDGQNNPLGVDDPMNNLNFLPTSPDVNNTLMFICGHNPGVWNNKISVRIRPSNPAGNAVGQNHNINHFILDVFYNYVGPNSTPVESYLVGRVPGEVDGNGAPMFVEDVVNKRSKYIKVRNNPYCAPVAVAETAFAYLNGGTDGAPVTQDMIHDAWELYEDSEDVDVNILINCGYTTPLVQRKLTSIAENRQDCTAILDMPFDEVEVADAINYRRNTLNINSSYAAMYGPWVKIRDTDNNKTLWVPPSGFVAGSYALTDNQRAVWFAPAGLNRGQLKILEVRKKYNQGMRGALDKAQINPIIKKQGRGFVIWGANTMQSHASSTENVNVRRLMNYIKKSIATACAVGVFDPNDTFLRLKLRAISEGFLKPIKQGRGLYDFDVICDERNNPNDVVAGGDLNIDVFADPVIPAKRIHLTAHIQRTGQASFIEN